MSPTGSGNGTRIQVRAGFATRTVSRGARLLRAGQPPARSAGQVPERSGIIAGSRKGPKIDPEHFEECVRAASEFARSVAGEDDAVYVQLLTAAVNIAASIVEGEDDGAARAASAARVLVRNEAAPGGASGALRMRGRRALEARDDAASIFHDAVLHANVRRLLADRTRIRGGVETAEFPDCVAVGGAADWCCSGTLVAPTVVVTAAHCYGFDCHHRVFVGEDVALPDRGRVVGLDDAVMHPEYQPPAPVNDIMVLLLDAPVVGVAPRRIADAAAVQRASTVRLVGYGRVDAAGRRGYGRRRTVDVPVASPDPRFGAEPELEFVAAEPLRNKDSCAGDSGGPAYVQENGGWYLAGATSRPVDNSQRECGDGGIYTRVPVYADWIKSVAGDRFVS